MSYSPPNPSALSPGCGFIRMTVDDLSYTPSAEEVSRHADQRIATGRRSWRMLKGRNEAVWPPYLEAALLEALERYQPLCSGLYRTPGRFPMRNQFISDFIHETTGKRRTPKQVGSRLQQLRDTSKKTRLVELISRREASDRETEPTPPKSTRTPEERPSAMPRHGDPVNVLSCQRPFAAYHDKKQSCVYETEPTNDLESACAFNDAFHWPEFFEIPAIRAAWPPLFSNECESNQISGYSIYGQRCDYLCGDRISNVGPWQMTPFVFP